MSLIPLIQSQTNLTAIAPRPRPRLGPRKRLAQAICAGAVLLAAQSVTAQHMVPTITVGTPLVRSYARIFPLLDGMLQDIAAIQAKQLMLDVTQLNGNSYNAASTQFGAQVSYSQTAALQNQATQQSLIAQQQYQSLVAQQNQQTQQQSAPLLAARGQAISALNAALQAEAANSGDTSAQTAVTTAGTALSTIQTALTLGAPAAPITPSFQSPLPTAPVSPPTLQTPAPNLAAAPSYSTPGTLLLPPTGLMDEQIDLLWQRLGRVGAAMLPTYSQNSDSLYFVMFPVTVWPGPAHRDQYLKLQFELTCENGNASPIVVNV